MARSVSKTRRRDPDEKRARILATATRLFAEQGFRQTATAQIAEEAEVSEGIVFHHFGSKKKLLVAVAAEHGHGATLAMFEHLVPGQPPDVEGMLRNLFEYVQSSGNLHELLILARDPSDWVDAIRAHREIIVGALAVAFEQWQRAGWVHSPNPRISASLMFGLVESALQDCFVYAQLEDWEPYLQECVRCIHRSMDVPDSLS